MTILHHAINSKSIETVAVIIKALNCEQDQSIRLFEINREVGTNKWTPLYRAGKHFNENITRFFFIFDIKSFMIVTKI
jgi:hypothetical protein